MKPRHIAVAAAALATTALMAVPYMWKPEPADAPATVTIAPGTYSYRPSGDWQKGGRVVDPAMSEAHAPDPLIVMKHQVSRGDYERCVAAGACRAVDGAGTDIPRTGVNWYDATAYARWYAELTGQPWRLPTFAEWQRFAAERFVDEAFDISGEDPAQRWLAQYARNVERRSRTDAAMRPIGGFGENSIGISDLAGNVWEWTQTCVIKGEIDERGGMTVRDEYCGARIAAGKHQAVIIDFVRDARAGGCGAGVPPDYLGFRLVRDG